MIEHSILITSSEQSNMQRKKKSFFFCINIEKFPTHKNMYIEIYFSLTDKRKLITEYIIILFINLNVTKLFLLCYHVIQPYRKWQYVIVIFGNV